MSSPTTETRCIECSRLKVPKKCAACKNPWYIRNGEQEEEFWSSTRTRTFDELADVVLKKLNSQGYCVVNKFHKEEKALAILEEVKAIHDGGLMHNGQLTSSVSSANIRGDQIAWIDGKEDGTENIKGHMERVDKLVAMLNKKITYYTIQERTKAMVACYPGEGKRYVKHVDNPHQDGRCITTLYYLNKDYDESVDGGVLRLYPGGGEQYIDIEPILDRFLIFWSDRRNPHEVLPAYSTRYAITLWYFDHNERQVEARRYLQKLDAEEKKNVVKEKGSQQFE